ncbi:MAG: SIS domain-containing protein [Deltaproteobacteria bacterium]|nr:SIS domain-containing protein [Deltaproteobacteria bacterium]NIS77438.1 SIS domain-containing protein [Deltaproteobacteria bacterium]
MRKQVLKQFKESADLILKVADELVEPIIDAAKIITEALRRGNKLLLFGNGGSAADSQHIAAEFVNRFMIERPPLPAIALTTDTSVITSIGNDYGFSEIFVKQIKALGNRGDVAIAISTSGASQNILKGVRAAKKMEIVTVGLTSVKGKKLIDLVDLPLVIPSEYTPRIQEAHIVVGHILCDMTDMMLFKNYKRKE